MPFAHELGGRPVQVAHCLSLTSGVPTLRPPSPALTAITSGRRAGRHVWRFSAQSILVRWPVTKVNTLHKGYGVAVILNRTGGLAVDVRGWSRMAGRRSLQSEEENLLTAIVRRLAPAAR